MLYERWREIARENRDAIALREIATGRNWTFEQLSGEVERRAPSTGHVFPRGDNAEFVLQVLEAWRSRSILCPLDAGQSATSACAAVPALWRMWADAQAIPGNVRLAISAAARLPLALERQVYERQGVKIHNFYGSSECGGIAYDRGTESRTEECCAGSAMENVMLTIGEDGCLCVESDAVAQTYWPEPQPDLGNRLFRTNDLLHITNRQVLLRGRASDQINVAC